jgi:hypothetical protein
MTHHLLRSKRRGAPSASVLTGGAKEASVVGVAFGKALRLGDPVRDGHICKLKLVKRQMYGRAKLDLLARRFLLAA